MSQPGLQSLRDDLAFMDDVAASAVVAMLTHHDTDTLTQEVSERRRRVAIAAYNLAAEMLAERRLRHQNALANATARRTA